MGFLDDLLPEVRCAISSPGYLDGLPEVPSRSHYSLRGEIVRADGGWALLVERKHVSPGESDRRLPELPLDEFLLACDAAHVDGFSCLACGPRFEGSPLEVASLADSVRRPVLFKDFVIDRIQISAAVRAGADAVLLLARLDRERRLDRPLRELALEAHRAGLEVLLELHDSADLEVAERVPADVYGINVRDLDSLELRPEIARATFENAERLRPLVGLSGVTGPTEARRFRAWGADGILVGTALARAADPVGFLHTLRVGANGVSS